MTDILRMRLVLTCLPTLGGSAITTSALAAALADRGHAVSVVAASRPFACGTTSAQSGQDGGGALVRDGVAYHWPAGDRHPVLGETATFLRLVELVGRVAADTRAEVVNPHYLGGLLPASALAVSTLARGAALVASAHGTDVTDPVSGTVALTRDQLRSAQAVTAVSPYLATELNRVFDLPVHRVRVIPNWVDDAPRGQARPDDDALLLVHSSNFRPVKRAARCADALAAAHAVRPARLLLVGDGPDREAVLARATELGVRNRVELAGVVDPVSAFTLVAAADVVLLPSASEACSAVLLQAMAAGLPAVAYDVAGNPGVLTHLRSGLLVPDEPGARCFAAAVARLAGSPGLRHALGSAARVEVERFARWRTLDAYEQVYREAVVRRNEALLRAAS